MTQLQAHIAKEQKTRTSIRQKKKPFLRGVRNLRQDPLNL